MPSLDTASLGPYPILQITAAFLVLVGLGFAVWRGIRDKVETKADDPDLERLSQLQLKLDLAEFQGAVSKVLEANREAFFKAMNDTERAIKIEIGELENRVRTLEIEHAGFREQLGNRRQR